MTGLDLAPIRARAGAASEGPWEAKPHQYRRNCLTVQQVTVDRKFLAHYISSEADAELMAHARSDVPALLAEVEDLRSRLACVAEASAWDRPYDERIAAIRGMCDLTQNGLTPIGDVQ